MTSGGHLSYYGRYFVKMAMLMLDTKEYRKLETKLFINDASATFLPNLMEFGEKLTEIDALVYAGVYEVCNFWPSKDNNWE